MSQLIHPTQTASIAAVDCIENEHPAREVLLALAEAPAPEQPLTASCSRRFSARRSSGRRPLSEIGLIVMHSTEGPSAQGAAAWFANPYSRGSAHLCLDDRECYRTLADDQIPWGAAGANYRGFHIEQAGYARWVAVVWSRTHRRMLNRAAYKAALHCRKYGIPPYFVTAKALRRGKHGVTTHKQCSDAFGGSHWDPGTGWPRFLFMTTLRFHYKRLAHVEQTA